MNIMVTGHRPNGMPGYGYDITNEKWQALQNKFVQVIRRYNDCKNITNEPVSLITGMALGVDQVFWKAAEVLRNESHNYSIEAAVPFAGQESKWFQASQYEYQQMIDRTDVVTIVSPGGYSAAKMDIRNKYMVDKSDLVIGVCCKNTGGTANCLRYAQSLKKNILIINPETLEVSMLKY